MASDPRLNKDFDNRYDNADLQMDRKTKDIAAAYTEYDEMKAYKTYIETLKAEASMYDGVATKDKDDKDTAYKGDGTNVIVTSYDADNNRVQTLVPINKLMPRQGEFEQARRGVIVKLNGMKDAELKQYFAEFETESMWELSSKVTNFLLDNRRRTRVTTSFKF
jgi:hypothetical protein